MPFHWWVSRGAAARRAALCCVATFFADGGLPGPSGSAAGAGQPQHHSRQSGGGHDSGSGDHIARVRTLLLAWLCRLVLRALAVAVVHAAAVAETAAARQPAFPWGCPASAHPWCTAALVFNSCRQAGFVANMSDIAPRHAGRLFGLSNTFGSLAGVVGVSGAAPSR